MTTGLQRALFATVVCAAVGIMPWANANAGEDRPEDEPTGARAEAVLEVASFGVGHRPSGGARVSAASAFYGVALAVGLSESLVDELVKVFSGEVDFHQELRGGYTCTVLFQTRYEEGMIVSGRILAAKLVTPEKTHTAFMFEDRSTFRGYYSGDGRPLQEMFLRSPVLFSRVTSGYAISRLHPILDLWRAHKGVDYAAPVGTPVRATGDGVIEFAGESGNLGKLVVLRHWDGISTHYGHLQSFNPSVRAGRAVRQGEIVGEVGTSGLSTGAHLHYEVRKLDRPVDPTLFHASYRQRLPAPLRRRFGELVERYERQLATVIRTYFIQID